MKQPKDINSWSDGIFEEPVVREFEKTARLLVDDLLSKGYSRFEIESLMNTTSISTILFKVI